MLVQLLALIIAAQPIDQIPSGTQLTYRGQFAADRGDAGVAEKSFELSLFVARKEDGATVYWTLEERGRGGWT